MILLTTFLPVFVYSGSTMLGITNTISNCLRIVQNLSKCCQGTCDYFINKIILVSYNIYRSGNRYPASQPRLLRCYTRSQRISYSTTQITNGEILWVGMIWREPDLSHEFNDVNTLKDFNRNREGFVHLRGCFLMDFKGLVYLSKPMTFPKNIGA